MSEINIVRPSRQLANCFMCACGAVDGQLKEEKETLILYSITAGSLFRRRTI